MFVFTAREITNNEAALTLLLKRRAEGQKISRAKSGQRGGSPPKAASPLRPSEAIEKEVDDEMTRMKEGRVMKMIMVRMMMKRTDASREY
eukprot:scaffold4092_cov105-Skeletonema_dohrnii-CCMP3373.AAC.5